MLETKREQIKQLLSVRHFVSNYTPNPEQVVFKIRGATVGTLQNFSCFVGLPKAGKSTFLNGLIASPHTSWGELFQMKLETPPGRPFIAYFDTESSQYDFYKNLERIKSLTKDKLIPGHLNAYAVREDNNEIIKAMIETYCEMNPMCSVIIIDGLLDLLVNYNDERESRLLIDWLKRITTQHNILIIGVVHLGKKDNNTLGHFGSMVDRYAQSVISIERDKENNLFLMKSKFLRSAMDFDDVAIQFNGQTYVEAQPPAPQPQTKKRG
jgi:hypothetical protein